jgi:hypothetical protein
VVLGVLEFVDEGDRVVLEGNTAVALGIGDQVVFAQSEIAYALAGLKECGRTEVSPINAALLQVPEHLDVSVDYGDPFFGKVSGLAQRDAWCDEEAARSAHYNEPRSTGLFDSSDEAIHNTDDLAGVVRWRPIGRDDGIRSLDGAGGLCWIAEIVMDCCNILDLGHLFWSASSSDDDVTAIDQFLENNASCLTCGSVENDFQLDLLISAAGCSDGNKIYPQAHFGARVLKDADVAVSV